MKQDMQHRTQDFASKKPVAATRPGRLWHWVILCGLLTLHCHTPKRTATMQENTANPLLCDPEEGACRLPGTDTQAAAPEVAPADKPLRIVYFTDPICSSCWGIEPQLRRLKLEYGHLVAVAYHMGGLLPSWDIYNSGGISKPSDVAGHWDEVSAHYNMPIDGDVWLEDPLPSSYPPSIAFKAAQRQDGHKALLFLRRIRELVFLEKKNITRWEHIAAAALEVGLDVARLQQDYAGAAEQDFQADLALARQYGVRGFPTLFVQDSAGGQVMLYGVRPYASMTAALTKLLPSAQPRAYATDWQSLFAQYPSLTAQEYAVLAGVDAATALEDLAALTSQGALRVQMTKNGGIWRR